MGRNWQQVRYIRVLIAVPLNFVSNILTGFNHLQKVNLCVDQKL